MFNTEKEVTTFLEEMMVAAMPTALKDRVHWAVQQLYFEGKQWARQASTASDPRIRILKNIMDPSRPDVRVTLNLVTSTTRKIDSKVSPNDIPFEFQPAGSSCPEDHILADLAECYMRKKMEAVDFLSTYDWSSFQRCILGTHLIKAVYRSGPEDENGYQDRNWTLCNVDPWQITLDPANHNPDIAEHHQWVIHTYVMPTSQLNARFKTNIESLGDYGQLAVESSFYNTLSGEPVSTTARDSKTPANLIHELYYGDEPGKYTHLYIMVRTKEGKLQMIWPSGDVRTPSPWPGLPFLKLDLWPRSSSPWGKGVPGELINVQDIQNLSVTNLMRYLVHGSWFKWIAPKNALTTESRKAILNNKMGGLIEYNQTYDQPKIDIVRPPELPKTAPNLLAMMPNLADKYSGLSDLAWGDLQARQPFKAVNSAMEAGDSIISNTVKRDALRLKRFLMTLTYFPVVHKTVFEVEKYVGKEFTPEQIALFLMQDPNEPTISTVIVPGSLMPKTPRQIMQEQLTWLQSGVLDRFDLRFNLFKTTGMAISSTDEDSLRLAMEENRKMMRGEPIQAWPHDQHEIHYLVHQMAYNNRATRFRLGGEVMNLLSQHMTEHEEALQVKQMATATNGTASGGRTSGQSAPDAAMMQGQIGGMLGGRSPNLTNVARQVGAPEPMEAM